MKKQSYHHGDLRAALIATGLRLLEDKGDGTGISLREVARATGVSATAVYRHFPDKDALLAALAAQGFEMLADTQIEEATALADRRAEFRAIGQGYVHFALANPALFRLMTSHMHLAAEDQPSTNRAANLLRDRLAELLPPDASEEKKKIAALQAWALVHGLAMLILGGQIPDKPELIEAAVDEFGPWR